jgi:hypothetical protein
MRRYLSIVISLIIIVIAAYVVVEKKTKKSLEVGNIGIFTKQKTCAKPPKFLKQLKIPQPVVIDLSQKRYKGIALHYGKNFSKTLHSKSWEQYGHFGTYCLDEQGNLYLAPIPFISIEAATFNLQKNIYKLDSKTTEINIFMTIDDIVPSSSNPYGVTAITYDCDDKTLWVSAIDESNYQTQKGIIYHIDIKTKQILQKIEGFDALSMMLLKSNKGKFLLAGSARDNGLYAYKIKDGHIVENPIKVLEQPSTTERIRKIKIKKDNTLELQTIPFTYTLIAHSGKKDRNHYTATWDYKKAVWLLSHEN